MTDPAQLYAIATGPSDINWRAAFVREHERADALDQRIAELEDAEKRKAWLELVAVTAELGVTNLEDVAMAVAAAKRLHELTGDPVCVDLEILYRHAICGPNAKVSWKCYSTRMKESAAGDTLAEAEAALRAKWEQFSQAIIGQTPQLTELPY